MKPMGAKYSGCIQAHFCSDDYLLTSEAEPKLSKSFLSGGRPPGTPLSITRTASLTEEEIKAVEKMRGVMLAVRPLLIEGVV